MNRVPILRREHQSIQNILIKMEELIDEDELDYKKFKNLYDKLIKIGKEHEKRETSFFKDLKKANIIPTPLERIFYQHNILEGHAKAINEAIKSDNPQKLKLALENDWRMILSKIRQHIFEEEIILDKVLFIYSSKIAYNQF